jgi:hypothetical protein
MLGKQQMTYTVSMFAWRLVSICIIIQTLSGLYRDQLKERDIKFDESCWPFVMLLHLQSIESLRVCSRGMTYSKSGASAMVYG